jgi:hypothetical protein
MTITPIIALALGAAALLASPAFAADSCSLIKSTYPNILLEFPGSAGYREEQKSYWSTICTNMKPTCLIFPATPEQVAEALSILRASNEPFSIKGKGHNPNAGMARYV